MQIGMIGLGRMGANMVRRLLRAGHDCVVYDVHPQAIPALTDEGAIATASLADFVGRLERPRNAWMMVPAAAVDSTLSGLVPLLEPDDTVIDGGNSFYQDDIRRAGDLKAKGLHYLDVGTSGGIWGLDRGYCLMIGGDRAAVQRLDPIFAALAPGIAAAARTPGRNVAESTAERGYLHCGPSGAGHFVKMVHNGIEYGLMAAYAEGLNILRHANAGKTQQDVDAETTPLRHPEYYQYDLNLAEIAEVWRRGSVIASWLLDLTAAALLRRAGTERLPGRVSDSGEGRWTVMAAIDERPRPRSSAPRCTSASARAARPISPTGCSRRCDRNSAATSKSPPRREAPMNAARSDAIVFFGATGDLAYKKVFPALQAMIRHEHFDVPVIGVANRAGTSINSGTSRGRAWSSTADWTRGPMPSSARCWATSTAITAIRPVRATAAGTGQCATAAALPGDPAEHVRRGSEGLAAAGCAKDARVVVEKPFGRDLASAQELNHTLHRFFPEPAIFRIDHYLGKEAVLNLFYFRFANSYRGQLGQRTPGEHPDHDGGDVRHGGPRQVL